jgi:hypothetical protein
VSGEENSAYRMVLVGVSIMPFSALSDIDSSVPILKAGDSSVRIRHFFHCRFGAAANWQINFALGDKAPGSCEARNSHFLAEGEMGFPG